MAHLAMQPVTNLQPVFHYVDRNDIPRSPRMERIAARLGEPGVMLPSSVAAAVLDDLVRACGAEDVGLRVGQTSRLEQVGPFGRRLCGVPTVAAGLGLMVSQRHNSSQRFVLSRRGPELWLLRNVSSSVRRGRRQERDIALMMVLHFLRLALGPGFRPTELHLEGPPPAHAEELADLAERAVHFGAQQTALVMSPRVLESRLPRASSASRPDELALTCAPAGFAASLRATVHALMQMGELSLATTAEAAGTSTRSLQRRLAEAGVHFADLVEEVRFERANALLRDPRAKVVAIAAELGYSDSANFTRAFRRWAGVPPLAFRRALLRESA